MIELTTGIKNDQSKMRYDLVPALALDGVVTVLTYGANKYQDRNWEKGIKWGRVFAAAMRHMWAWWRGEENDPESGISHLSHAACNIFFLIHYEKMKMGDWDDRPHKT